MLTLYSYPTLFGVADNNGYGLKVFAFLKLAGVPFRHEHIFDASKAPRGQLPYIVDGADIVGDSETILGFVTEKYALTIDAALTPAQRTTNLLVTRMLDDLYWVMSYSRWKDERYWPAVPRCAAARASEPDRRRPDEGEGVQRPALSLPGHRPLRSRRRHGARARRSRGTRRADPARMAMCMARSRPASTPASMASSPTSISTTSIRR